MANGVPTEVIIPFVGVQFDATRAFAGPATVPIQTLIIGQKVAAGTGLVNTLYLVSNPDRVAELAGNGSQAHIGAVKYFLNNKTTVTQLMLQDDAGGAAKSTQVVTMAGAATAPGSVIFYVNGVRYEVSVANAASVTTIATDMATEITDDANSPFTAGNVAGVLTLTAKNGGVAAGEMDFRFNLNAGELLPAGVTGTVGAYVAGTVEPDAQDIVDNLGDAWFQVIVGAYADTTNLTIIQDYLADMFDVLNQRDGMYFFGKKDTRSNLITFATNSARNSQHVAMGDTVGIPQTSFETSSAYAGQLAASVQGDPATPLHRMTLVGITPKIASERYEALERNQLAANGIMTYTSSLGVQSESTVTMYLKNAAGSPDPSYQYQNNLYILQRLRYTWVQRILSRYPRAKLANTTDNIGPGQQIMTPDIGKTESIAWFKLEQLAGQVEGLDQFKDELVVVRDPSNVNRLNFLLSPDIINQFIVGSANMQFQLQAATT